MKIQNATDTITGRPCCEALGTQKRKKKKRFCLEIFLTRLAVRCSRTAASRRRPTCPARVFTTSAPRRRPTASCRRPRTRPWASASPDHASSNRTARTPNRSVYIFFKQILIYFVSYLFSIHVRHHCLIVVYLVHRSSNVEDPSPLH